MTPSAYRSKHAAAGVMAGVCGEGATMDDHVARLFAGHMGVSAVLTNILIDKRLVSRGEALSYFQQAHDAAARCSGGTEVAQALAAMITYLDEAQKDH